MAAGKQDIKFLTTVKIGDQKKKFCWFKKARIKHIDYKDPDFLIKFVNTQGKILPRRLTGTSLKYQRKLSTAIKKSRQLALMPYMGDQLR